MEKKVIAILIAIMALASCAKTQYVDRVHTEYVNRTDTFLKHDSIYQRDSIIISQKGDTVTVDRWHTKHVTDWMYETKTDTLLLTDTIVKEVVKEVERESSWIERLGVAFGVAVFIMAAYVIAVLIIRSKYS